MSVPKTRASNNKNIKQDATVASKEAIEAKTPKIRSNTQTAREPNPIAVSKEGVKPSKIRGNDRKTVIAASKEGETKLVMNGPSRVTTTEKRDAEIPETLIKAPVYDKRLTDGSIQWDCLPSDLATLGYV